jgi:RNA-binding protein Tab2/Atab2
MATVWEIDFYSRPILDESGKKLWELLICESPLSVDRPSDSLFRDAYYCPSATVNSEWLGNTLKQAMEKSGQSPQIVRFFRRQMNNMIVKACTDIGLDAKLGRRTVALNAWMEDRLVNVYPQEPGYQDTAITSPAVQYQSPVPLALPDALQGQQWAFVTLEAQAFDDMPDWDIDFGEGFPLALANLEGDRAIPGLIVFSSRAFPLAAWMSGLELGFLKYTTGRAPRLILETGGNDAWVLADVVSDATQTEAVQFETAKQAANGVHFLAVQSDPNSETFAGFWLLQELNLA